MTSNVINVASSDMARFRPRDTRPLALPPTLQGLSLPGGQAGDDSPIKTQKESSAAYI